MIRVSKAGMCTRLIDDVYQIATKEMYDEALAFIFYILNVERQKEAQRPDFAHWGFMGY